MEDLPIYKVTIDEDYNDGVEPLGIDQVAFTANPAVLVKGVAFHSHQKLSFSDSKKFRITAPAMIPMDIYRKDEGGEYYVQFSESEIENLFKDFMENLNNKDLFNLEHDAGQTVPAYVLEAWLVNTPTQDKAFSTFGITVPKGTLMMTAQITDEDYYNKLVESEQVGFSIEGFLGLKLSNQLNKYSMKLPDGEHTIDGKIYVVKDGEVIEVKDVEVAMEEEVVEEVEEVAMEEEVIEEEVAMEEEVPAVVVEEEMAVDPATDSEAIIAIVTPLIESAISEILQVIADLKNELTESTDVAPVAEVEMSATQKFSNIQKFLQTNG